MDETLMNIVYDLGTHTRVFNAMQRFGPEPNRHNVHETYGLHTV